MKDELLKTMLARFEQDGVRVFRPGSRGLPGTWDDQREEFERLRAEGHLVREVTLQCVGCSAPFWGGLYENAPQMLTCGNCDWDEEFDPAADDFWDVVSCTSLWKLSEERYPKKPAPAKTYKLVIKGCQECPVSSNAPSGICCHPKFEGEGREIKGYWDEDCSKPEWCPLRETPLQVELEVT